MRQWRKQRFPSAWECEMVFRHAGRMLVEVRNVSETGMRVVTERKVQENELARIMAGGHQVQGIVRRVDGIEVGVEFEAALSANQLANLRQFRRLNARKLG